MSSGIVGKIVLILFKYLLKTFLLSQNVGLFLLRKQFKLWSNRIFCFTKQDRTSFMFFLYEFWVRFCSFTSYIYNIFSVRKQKIAILSNTEFFITNTKAIAFVFLEGKYFLPRIIYPGCALDSVTRFIREGAPIGINFTPFIISIFFNTLYIHLVANVSEIYFN